MKKYKGKISALAAILLALPLLGLGHFIYNAYGDIFYLTLLRIIYNAAILCLLYIVFSRKYVIDGEKLLLKTGEFRNQSIPISKIHSIETLESPIDRTFKLDRWILRYNNHQDFDYLSVPKKSEEFIQDLLAVNPNIELKIKEEKPAEEQEKSNSQD